MIDLQLFCSTDKNLRSATPFLLKGFVYAVSGHFSVKLPSPEDCEYTESISFSLFAENKSWLSTGKATLIKLPDVEVKVHSCGFCKGYGALIDCPECGNNGEVELENDFNSYTEMCKTCDGVGRTYFDDKELAKLEKEGYSLEKETCGGCSGSGKYCETLRVSVSGFIVSEDVFLKLKLLPNVKFIITENSVYFNNTLRFLFDGGEGILIFLEQEEG